MIETSVKQIHQWLMANAPRIPELSLNEGATDQAIELLESRIDYELPADFKELYRTWNGMNNEETWGNFFYGLSFLTIGEIITDHEFRKNKLRRAGHRPLKNADPEIDRSSLYNPAWIGLGTDGAESALRLDLSPTPAGRPGQIIFINDEYQVGICVASSTLDLLWKFSNDLQNNLYTLEPDALEEGQHFLQPDKKIDLINSFCLEKWNYLYNV